MKWIFKKKSKTRKFKIKTSYYGIVLLLNFIKKSISSIKNEISNSVNPDELKDLIAEKYVLMSIAEQLGITIYNEEMINKKSSSLELKEILKQNKKNIENLSPLDKEKTSFKITFEQ